jgi:hypothetical protein
MGATFIREPRNALLPKFDSMSDLEVVSYPNVSASWGLNGQEKTLIMYHDSFGMGLQPFLQHHFKQATYILNSSTPIASNMAWIETTKPDVLIIEIAERSLSYLGLLISNE